MTGLIIRLTAALLSIFAFLIAFSMLSTQAVAQTPSILPAFPGAEGFGAGAIGGRGGRVVFVTTLADSGPGSLRAALTATGPRIVVFRVGGTINLLTRITLTAEHSFLTVAGHTAPGDGIQIRGYDIAFSGVRDIVLRYLRLRPGDSGPLISSKSSIIFTGDSATNKSQNIMLDHCSFYWGPDENVNLWDYVENVTVQWSITEGMAHDTCPVGSTACQFEESKSYLVGTDLGNGDRLKNVTLHHNLMANTAQRNPSLASNGPHHIINNVVYNWRDFGTSIWNRNADASNGVQVNLIGNIYVDGPLSNRNRFPIGVEGDVRNPDNYVYVSGNRGRSPLGTAATDWDLVSSGYDPTKYWTQQLPISFRRATPWPDSPVPVTVTPTNDVVETVIAGVGATKPVRDALDLRVIEDFRQLRGFVRKASQANLLDYPTLQGGTAPTDTDGDGMPDDWERRFGLNPNDASDGKLDANDDGYTNIEEYLNETIPTKTLNVACNLDFSGDNQIDATDAMLLLRWLFGFRSAALVNGVMTIPAGGSIDQVTAAVEARMQLTIAHDVDGDGSLVAGSDGLLLLRLMRGAKGSAAINATLGQGFSRGTYEKIRVHLNSHCETSLLPE
jgi:pectate lyase